VVGFLGLTTPEAFASTVKGFRKGLGEAPADDGSALIFWLRTALRGRRCDVRKSGCHRACPRACATLPLETGHRAPAGRALEGLYPAPRQNRQKALSSVLAVPWRGLSGPAGPWGWRISPDREVGPLQPQPRRTRTFCLANGEPLRPIRRCERRSPPAVARLIGAGLCGSEPNRTVSVGHGQAPWWRGSTTGEMGRSSTTLDAQHRCPSRSNRYRRPARRYGASASCIRSLWGRDWPEIGQLYESS